MQRLEVKENEVVVLKPSPQRFGVATGADEEGEWTYKSVAHLITKETESATLPEDAGESNDTDEETESGAELPMEKWAQANGASVRRLDEDTTIVCFRIVQEALQNVAKHADATSVAIRMDAADGGVVLSIRDDGRGFQPGNSGDDSFGLLGMEEGVRSVGGRFACTTGPGQGTEVRVWLPRLPLSAVTAAEGWA